MRAQWPSLFAPAGVAAALILASAAPAASIVAARLIVFQSDTTEFPAIPLTLGTSADVPYPPEEDRVAYTAVPFSGEVPVDHPNFGPTGLPKGIFFYTVEVEDAEGNKSRSPLKLLTHEGRSRIVTQEWMRCTARWDMAGPVPGGCGGVQTAPVSETDGVPVIHIPEDANQLGPGQYWYYVRVIDESNRVSAWREYTHEVWPHLPLLGAEYAFSKTTTAGGPLPPGSGRPIELAPADEEFRRAFSEQIFLSDLPTDAPAIVYVRAQRDIPRRPGVPVPGVTGGRWGEWAELRLNRCPAIGQRSPATGNLLVSLGSSLAFSVQGSDPDADPLQMELLVNNEVVATGTPPLTFTFDTPGPQTVIGRLTDGTCDTDVIWNVTVSQGTGWILSQSGP